MFSGEYEHTLDQKGRLIIPAKFREQLGTTFIMTKGFDGCLFVYSDEEWHRIEESLKNKSMLSKQNRQFMRTFFSGAAECEVDKQGRIVIPPKLRDFAGIEKNVISIGVYSRVEIWSKERYEAETDSYDNLEDFADQMEELGIPL